MSKFAQEPQPTLAEILIFARNELDQNPNNGYAWSLLGSSLRSAGRSAEAIAAHRRGIELDPHNASIWSNLGNALMDAGRLDDALAAHAKATSLDAHSYLFRFNQLVAQRRSGDFNGALISIEILEKLDPENKVLAWERALIWLQIGDYARGFSDYAARRYLPSFFLSSLPGKEWDGTPLNGRRIFLASEQGFGDALLVARYIAQVKALGGHVIYQYHPELRDILGSLPADEFHARGDTFPDYDTWLFQMDLPAVLGARIDNIPAPVTLSVPQASRAKLTKLIGQGAKDVLRVGIVWSGRVTFGENNLRATELKSFMRLAEVPSVRLYSLQKDSPAAELDDADIQRLITPLGPHLDHFGDTAAAIELLDLVIMTDSSVAHLASAMGKPVWNLLQHVPYWIYGVSKDSTPWYPTMRLFRQDPDRDWSRVFMRVAEALQIEVRKRRNFSTS
jgi:tetratricopeptide (TPR) repeat protein